ncbi:MAG: kdpC [Acidimicrobiales bacterium]|jgi:K+-transporting ATPase ATPase C chain|nr:kdpC [Acidimicrobiales bacterium]
MRRQIRTALAMTIALIILTGVLYPLAVTVIGTVAFQERAAGSLVSAHGHVVGSALLGQSFSDQAGKPLPQYFQPRPSAAGAGYDGLASGASNLGPANPKLLDAVAQRVKAYRAFNGVGDGTPVPVDAVTASGSGLDPHITVANARLQARRVADNRHLALPLVLSLIDRHTQGRQLGFLGEKVVNVLELNLDLDRQG